MSRRKDRYIGRLYSDIEKVLSDSGIFRSTAELREYILGLIGPYEKEGKGPQGWRTPPLGLVRIGLGKGGRPLPSFSLSLPLFLFHMGGGILLGLRSPSRTPHLACPLLGPASSSLAPLYTGAGGTPKRQHLILEIY